MQTNWRSCTMRSKSCIRDGSGIIYLKHCLTLCFLDRWVFILRGHIFVLQIDHPNCVKLYEMFETSKKLYMVLELLTGGELFDRIVAKGSYSEKEAAAIIKDIASAIKYLHSIGVVHRDLKVLWWLPP